MTLVNANIKGLVENAYPLESHLDEKPKNPDMPKRQIVTFGSVLRSGKDYIPVKFTVFFNSDSKNPVIHIAVADKMKRLESFESTNFSEENAVDDQASEDLVHNSIDTASDDTYGNKPSSLSVIDYIKFVKDNPNFVKRLPVDLILGEKVAQRTNKKRTILPMAGEEKLSGGDKTGDNVIARAHIRRIALAYGNEAWQQIKKSGKVEQLKHMREGSNNYVKKQNAIARADHRHIKTRVKSFISK